MAAARKRGTRQSGRPPHSTVREAIADAPIERRPDRDSTPRPVQADPPRAHLWFLVASSAAVALWLGFLLAMALRGS